VDECKPLLEGQRHRVRSDTRAAIAGVRTRQTERRARPVEHRGVRAGDGRHQDGAVQVDPIKLTLKAPGIKQLNL
jgi:arginine/lysine/ornithine decarboxylase